MISSNKILNYTSARVYIKIVTTHNRIYVVYKILFFCNIAIDNIQFF